MACELQKERKRECACEFVREREKDKRERYLFSRELTHQTGKKNLIVQQNTPK